MSRHTYGRNSTNASVQSANAPHPNALNHRQGGSSLLEILISLVIMAMGMLGAVKLQLNSSQGTLTTTHGVTAAALGSEVMDSIGTGAGDINWTLGMGQTANVPLVAQAWLAEVKAKIPTANAQICTSCTYPSASVATATCPSATVAPPIWLATIQWTEHGVVVCRSFQARQ